MAESFNFNDTPVVNPTENNSAEINTGIIKPSEYRAAQTAMAQAGSEKPLPGLRIVVDDSDAKKAAEAQAKADAEAEAKMTPEQKKERETLKAIAKTLDSTGNLDVKTLAPILQKHIDASKTPRQEANDVLDVISRNSEKYKLSIQGIGENMMIYRQGKVPKAESALLPLPGVTLNDRPQRTPQRPNRR
jgi:hypothetical protein